MFKNDIRYQRSFCDGFTGCIGVLVDLFLLPLVFQGCWNYVMPQVFDVKEITYVHALLFKFSLVLYAAPFSVSHELYIWYETLSHYSNSLYTKLTDIETSLSAYMNARNNQRHVYPMNAAFDMV